MTPKPRSFHNARLDQTELRFTFYTRERSRRYLSKPQYVWYLGGQWCEQVSAPTSLAYVTVYQALKSPHTIISITFPPPLVSLALLQSAVKRSYLPWGLECKRYVFHKVSFSLTKCARRATWRVPSKITLSPRCLDSLRPRRSALSTAERERQGLSPVFISKWATVKWGKHYYANTRRRYGQWSSNRHRNSNLGCYTEPRMR